ncbi:hypothetical protein GCM10009554_17870 [Kribbella koreensis]|uniref:Uncharacterized protein n=1 Tax=Kribbella koreensis TaxID=57909 RepID=A0ABP4A8K3_9ACTN
MPVPLPDVALRRITSVPVPVPMPDVALRRITSVPVPMPMPDVALRRVTGVPMPMPVPGSVLAVLLPGHVTSVPMPVPVTSGVRAIGLTVFVPHLPGRGRAERWHITSGLGGIGLVAGRLTGAVAAVLSLARHPFGRAQGLNVTRSAGVSRRQVREVLRVEFSAYSDRCFSSGDLVAGGSFDCDRERGVDGGYCCVD